MTEPYVGEIVHYNGIIEGEKGCMAAMVTAVLEENDEGRLVLALHVFPPGAEAAQTTAEYGGDKDGKLGTWHWKCGRRSSLTYAHGETGAAVEED